MGDIADMMLEGILCQGCGEYLGEGDGFPAYCSSCQSEMNIDAVGEPSQKEACPICGKRKKNVAQHMRDVHGVHDG